MKRRKLKQEIEEMKDRIAQLEKKFERLIQDAPTLLTGKVDVEVPSGEKVGLGRPRELW